MQQFLTNNILQLSAIHTQYWAYSKSEPNDKKYHTHIEYQTLRWNKMGKQNKKNLLMPKWLMVINPIQKAVQNFKRLQSQMTMRKYKVINVTTNFLN